MSYRYLRADDWFILDTLTPSDGSRAPGGESHLFRIHSVDFSAAYGVTSRLSLRLTIPTASGTNSRVHQDGVRRETKGSGIGDVNLVGTLWLLDPLAHGSGNAAISLGVKAPTGSNTIEDDYGLPTGVVQHPVHPGIQMGDGGWGVLVGAQGFLRLADGLSAYALLAYQISPQDTTEVKFTPAFTSGMSVADVYHAKVGIAYAVLPERGLAASLGFRTDGIPTNDLIGDSDGFRSAARIVSLDPGLSWTFGRNDLTVSLPIRVHGEFKRGVPLPPPNFQSDQGDLAQTVLFVAFNRRL
ncbi:MAG TPA: hypothetical protein VLD61_07015 [Methylomirabilota bacterium]|nr:hypothetical protein [Methylomirabilota bacterium]